MPKKASPQTPTGSRKVKGKSISKFSLSENTIIKDQLKDKEANRKREDHTAYVYYYHKYYYVDKSSLYFSFRKTDLLAYDSRHGG